MFVIRVCLRASTSTKDEHGCRANYALSYVEGTARFGAERKNRGKHGQVSVKEWKTGARDQIEYPDEDPMIHEKFESELERKGLQSVMPTKLTETGTTNGVTRKN